MKIALFAVTTAALSLGTGPIYADCTEGTAANTQVVSEAAVVGEASQAHAQNPPLVLPKVQGRQEILLY